MRRMILFLWVLSVLSFSPARLLAENIEGFSPTIAVVCNPMIQTQDGNLGLSLDLEIPEASSPKTMAYSMTGPATPIILLNASDGVDFDRDSFHLNISGKTVFLVEAGSTQVFSLGEVRLEGLKCNGQRQYVRLSFSPGVSVDLDRPVQCNPRTHGVKVRMVLPEASSPILVPFRFSC